MKILMQGRTELFDVGGGDMVQIENTAAELRRLGVEVDISTSLNADLTPYDLVHIFQLDWVPEPYFFAKRAKEFGKPLILSPIHHAEKDVKNFDDNFVFGFRRISKFLFRKQEHRDILKNIYRALSIPQKIKPTLVSMFMGFRNMQREVLKMSDVVLVQTKMEAEDLTSTYGIEINWQKVPNGVGRVFLQNQDNLKPVFDFDKYILCVGRIEPRKNQLNIIRAVHEMRDETMKDVNLVFVGKKNKSRHYEYVKLFENEVKTHPWIYYVNQVSYDSMPSLYKYSAVCVSASWFETTGLTGLEALFCGANVVASGDRAMEYLDKYASYCKPDDVNSIKSAIIEAYVSPSPQIDKHMVAEYTWENAAKKTLEVYKSVLKIS